MIKRIVVTGIGPLCSTGIGKELVWNGLLNSKTGIDQEKFYINKQFIASFFKHKVRDFNIYDFPIKKDLIKETKIWQKNIEIIDLYYLIAAIKLALEDSNFNHHDTHKIGLVIAHENPGLEPFCTNLIKGIIQDNQNKLPFSKLRAFKHFYSFNNRSAYELQSFMFLFHISKILGIHGYSLIINNACASGLYAIEAASDIIKSGKSEVVIVGASDYTGIYKHLWLKESGLYAEDGKTKPFCINRHGFVCGDGGTALVLEEFNHAKRRKAHIYAEYLGGGFSLEGWKVTLPSISNDYYRDAILEVLGRCKVNLKEVDLINAHGVGTTIIDRYEAKAITEVFGKKFEKPLINAFKPYIGHNLGGSALLETAILLISMEKNVVLPILNCEEIDPLLNIKVILKNVSTELKTTLKLCCGFGGYNAAALFRKVK